MILKFNISKTPTIPAGKVLLVEIENEELLVWVNTSKGQQTLEVFLSGMEPPDYAEHVGSVLSGLHVFRTDLSGASDLVLDLSS
jgi:hypothetical protein